MPVKQRYELWAEAIRDIGILFLVFAPLDTLLSPKNRPWWEWLIAALLGIMGWVLVDKGIRMESEK
jgi:hypothetical protein